jgi:hypothetical protein
VLGVIVDPASLLIVCILEQSARGETLATIRGKRARTFLSVREDMNEVVLEVVSRLVASFLQLLLHSHKPAHHNRQLCSSLGEEQGRRKRADLDQVDSHGGLDKLVVVAIQPSVRQRHEVTDKRSSTAHFQ